MDDKSYLEAKELFESISPEGWNIVNEALRQGSQSSVLVVQNLEGIKGVFRHLKRTDSKSLLRFKREINIVLKHKHPSIMNLLDYSKDEKPWYISEKGMSFQHYWSEQRKILKDEPEELVNLAVFHIKQLLVGLAPLHNEGIIHRDIKPQNLIVQKSNGQEVCVIIDFGLAYKGDEERISDENEAVGNRRFSPDKMVHRVDNPSPWLDVFEIVQVFMYMIHEQPLMHYWSRPVAWRWVNYDSRLPERVYLIIQAISAVTSEEDISPKNAGELFNLFSELFPVIKKSEGEGIKFDLSSIKEEKIKLEASKLINESKRIAAYKASFPRANLFYEDLTLGLEEVVKELKDMDPKPSMQEITRFSEFVGNLGGKQFWWQDLLRINLIGDIDLGILVEAYAPDAIIEHPSNPMLSVEDNRFVFRFHCLGREIEGSNGAREQYNKYTVLRPDGTVTLRNQFGDTTGKSVTSKEIVSMLSGWLTDVEAWKSFLRHFIR